VSAPWMKEPPQAVFVLALADALYEDVLNEKRYPFAVALRRAVGLSADALDEEVVSEILMYRLDAEAYYRELGAAEALRRKGDVLS